MLRIALPMAFEETAAAVRQGDGALASIQGHALDESLLLEAAEVSVTHVERGIARVAQVALGDDTKRANGRQSAHVGAVQPTVATAVANQFTFWSTREVEVTREDVARIDGAAIILATTRVAVALVAVPIRSIVVSCC
ncbi:MAG: hypothetical protein Q8M65_07530 [Rhodoglobus sp.]|nr:hypothetical protein [Rhodoglobus sp.]